MVHSLLSQKKKAALCLLCLIMAMAAAAFTQAASKKPVLNKKKLTMAVSEKKKLKVKKKPAGTSVAWSVTKGKSVVAVNKNGTVRAKKQGNAAVAATVTYQEKGRKKKLVMACKITVRPKAEEGGANSTEQDTSGTNGTSGGKGDAAGVDFEPYTRNSKISDVIKDAAWGGHGRLLFPVDAGYYSGGTLENLRLTWYTGIDPDKTVEIVNTLKAKALSGETVFYDIYTDAEKAADPDKADTGLFYFKGKPGAKFAVCNAGGGFAYVGAMHDSFPHALELSKKGYNAFALIYRPGAQTACEDLARAIAFIHTHADELEVDTEGYSLWGGSAGARMAAWLGSYGTEGFGETTYPRPAAVIMQYTGLSEVTGTEPPTYNCVGTSDGIASWRTMERRVEAIKANGTDAEIEVFQGLSHGFGLGMGTVAEGWLDRAVAFWECQM